MSPIVVLVGVGAIAAFAVATLTLLIIGIHKGDRRHLANAPRSNSEAFARRLLLGIRYPASEYEETEDSK